MTRVSRARDLLAVAALAVATGCIASVTHRDHAFVPALPHYRVRYEAGGQPARRVLPETWSVTSHRVDDQGRPTGRIEPLETVDVGIDLDRDRRADVRGVAPRHDVRYQHRTGEAQITASTIPVDPRRAQRPLAVLARRLLGGGWGTGFVDDAIRDHTPTVIEAHDARVGGAPAFSITFDLEPAAGGAARERVTLVVIRPPLRWRETGLASPEDGAPMLVVWTYRAHAERHARHLRDFEGLLDRIDVRSR